MRIATGAICHETSTFTTVLTTWESWCDHRFGYITGDAILDKFRDTNSAIGGFMGGAEKHGFELIPTIFANANPSGVTSREVFDRILTDMIQRMSAAGPLDGVILSLHGAMVAEGVDDGEGHILEAIRNLVGSFVPIISELDIHTNMSKRMVEMADALVVHQTFPEIDQEECGLKCANIMNRMLREGLRPTMALHQLPLVWGMNQITKHPPMCDAIAELHQIEAQPEVVTASICTAFPLADIPHMGASVIVTTDNDEALAQKHADELAAYLWSRRDEWQSEWKPTRDYLEQAESEGKFPVVFADRNDNTGGGAPGDGTAMLSTFIEADLQDACLLNIVDPEAVAECEKAGVGVTLTLKVGAKSTLLQGEPIEMTVEVVALSDGSFQYEGPRNRGLSGSMGPSAHIVQDGVHVILVSEREQPYDTALARTLGLEPRNMRYVGLKSAGHFRACYEEFAGNIFSVSEPNVHDHELIKGHYKNLGRKLYPFDDIDSY